MNATAASAAETAVFQRNQSNLSFLMTLATRAGYEKISIQGWHHEIVSPGDAGGSRSHSPFQISKALDESSSRLLGMMLQGEVIPQVTIDVNQNNAEQRTPYLRVQLKDARITGYRPSANTDVTAADASQQGAVVEEIEFVYHTITWEFAADGGTVLVDDWATSPGD
jgi:type VI secretion system Hcp family effector